LVSISFYCNSNSDSQREKATGRDNAAVTNSAKDMREKPRLVRGV